MGLYTFDLVQVDLVPDLRVGVRHEPSRKHSGPEARLVPLRRLQEQLDSSAAAGKHPGPVAAWTAPVQERDSQWPVRCSGERFSKLPFTSPSRPILHLTLVF